MKVIAGVDEVGRGSLVGPVYAAAVILNHSINKKLLKDSKKLSKKRREILAKYIKKNSIWAVGRATVAEIEKKKYFTSKFTCNEKGNKKAQKKTSLNFYRW